MSTIINVSLIDILVSACYKVPMDRFYMEFGRLLRESRNRPGFNLTQQDLAEKVGLSRTSITNIELGKQHISLHMLFKLAHATGLNPEKLLPSPQFVAEQLPIREMLKTRIDQLSFSPATKESLRNALSSDDNIRTG